MVIEGCNCQEGLGLYHDPHWHPNLEGMGLVLIRLWVDWKAVAKALCIDGSSPPSASAGGSARGGEEAVPRFSDPAPGCDQYDGEEV